jgi:hypothetical protein
MRCILGLVLFVALCYGGLQTLSAVAAAREAANDPGLSQRAAQAAGWKVAEKHHALVYAAAGLITIVLCSLPTLLSRETGFDEAKESRRIAAAARR